MENCLPEKLTLCILVQVVWMWWSLCFIIAIKSIFIRLIVKQWFPEVLTGVKQRLVSSWKQWLKQKLTLRMIYSFLRGFIYGPKPTSCFLLVFTGVSNLHPTTLLASSITRIPRLGLYQGFLSMSFDWQTPPLLGPQHPHQYGERSWSVNDFWVLYKREIELQATRWVEVSDA